MAEPTEIQQPPADQAQPPKSKSFLDVIEDQYRDSIEKESKAKEPAPKSDETPTDVPAEPPKDKAPVQDVDEPEPKGMSANAASNWKKLKAERNDYSQKLKAAQAELEAERAKPRPDPKEIEAIKAERDAYSQRLQQLDVERHPKFQAYFEQKTTATLGLAKSIVGEANAKRLQDVLEMPDGQFRDSALEEISAELKPIQQNRLGAVVVEYDKIRQERSQHIAESRTNWQKLQEDQQRQAQQTQAQYLKAFEEATSRATDPKEGLPVFQKRSGNTEADLQWNRQVDESLALAKNIYQGKMDAPEIAKAALWSASAPLFLAQLNERNTVISGLQKRISELEAAKPRLSSASGATPDAPTDKYKGLSYIDAMVAQVNEAGGFQR